MACSCIIEINANVLTHTVLSNCKNIDMKIFINILIVIVVALFWNCSSPKEKNDLVHESNQNRTVNFKGREIDLTPYVEGFPYNNFNPFYAAGKLYYMKTGMVGKSFNILRITSKKSTNKN